MGVAHTKLPAFSSVVFLALLCCCRACRIKNQPLPNKQLLLEEDLLPLLPANSSTGTMSVTQMQVRPQYSQRYHGGRLQGGQGAVRSALCSVRRGCVCVGAFVL